MNRFMQLYQLASKEELKYKIWEKFIIITLSLTIESFIVKLTDIYSTLSMCLDKCKVNKESLKLI